MGERRFKRRWRSWLAAGLVGVLTFTGFVVIALVIRGDRPPQIRPVAVASGEWAPFVGSDLPNGGPVAEIMGDVLQQAGYEPQLTFSSWSAVDQRTAEGSVFGGFPLVGSAERSARMILSEPLLSFDYVLFVRADDTVKPTSAEELRGLRVGGIAGYDYWRELEDAATEIVRFDTTVDGFEALQRGDIDVFAEGEASGYVALESPDLALDAAQFEVLPGDDAWVRSTQHLYFMMPRSSDAERALERIDESIALVKRSPDYRRLLIELQPHSRVSDRVVLRGTALVPLSDADGDVVARTPPGVIATVLEWPENLGADGTDGALVRVKLGDGPHAGRILWVPASNLEVVR